MSLKRSVNNEAGFTLVELMIAMVLSLMIMGGTLALFAGTKSTFLLQRAVSQVQSDGNAVLTLLEHQVRLAGYPQDSLLLESGVIGNNGKGGNYSVSASASAGFSASASSDTTLIFQFLAPQDNFFNCAGENFNDGDEVAVRIALIDNDNNGTTDLTCQGGGAAVTLVDNVSNLQFEYGEQSTAAASVPIQYKAYAAVSNVRNVLAIRMEFDVGSDHPDVQARTFSTTVPIRNQVR